VDSFSGFNAAHHFTDTGKYFVKLRGTSASGYSQWYSDTIMNMQYINAYFGFTNSVGCQWVGFQFHDSSTTNTKSPAGFSWHWVFGDGTTSNLQNPVHIYTKSGTYYITLVYSNGVCSDTFTRPQPVTILPAPDPGFAVNDTTGCLPLTINITDKSVGSVSKYFYNFGNGLTDTMPSTQTTYTVSGIYRILQTLTGTTGCITKDSVNIHVYFGFTAIAPVNILSASVLAPHAIKINWLPLTGAANYTVYLHKDGITAQLATTPDTAFYDTLTPLSVFTTDSSYYYIRATDSCGNTSLPSAIARPMLLTATNHDNQYALINWTPYEYWPTVPTSGGFRGVALSYQIQVLQNGSFTGYFDTPDTAYTDNAFFDSTLSSSQRCYRIEAIQNGGNHATSYSNIVCVPYLPTFWVPTAFTPNGDGLNDVFKVTAIGISSSAFSLKIFNAWGEFIYQTTDPNQGWDGTFHGKPSPEGPYLYIITATMNENKTINTSGTLNLMR